ncbi:MAG TPA: GNAT family N-acetyltransferase [Solirubrobacteraceae bacterium]|jgi:GNAT superfamily N-acetyltransferase|nr:GNAT family N-acetyltransferase [Solirubrobacteraceae bacterium]
MSDAPLVVRDAARADVPLLMTLIRELADYEKLGHELLATEELMERALFASPPAAEALIAEQDGEAVGYALFYSTFSTFLAIQGIWLEDLYVRPTHRKAGAGRALLASVAARLRERGGERLEWAALDWNELALGFYRGLGAQPMNEWITHRLIGEDLQALAAQAPTVEADPPR